MSNEITLITENPDFKKLGKINIDFFETASNFEVKNKEDFERGTIFLSQISEFKKAVEASKEFIYRPAKEVVDNISKRYKPLLDGIDDCINKIKRPMTEFATAERKRIEAEQAKEQARLEKLADKAELKPTANNIAKVEASADKIASLVDSAPKNTREVWKFELLSLAKVPLEFLQLNEQAVRAALASGVREIGGLKIYSEQSIIAR